MLINFSALQFRAAGRRAVPAMIRTLLLVSFSAASQAADNRLETMVVTASRMPQSTDQLANSISVITERDIEQVAHIHVSELLARTPGVWVSRGNGQEHLTAIRSPVLTGAGSCGAFYIAEDGIPVRATGFCNVNELFDLNTEQAQRIEVLRGPGTALHGSNALHGVINVISYSPMDNPPGQLALEGGPHDYGRVKLAFGDADQHQGYRVSVNGASDGGYKDDSGFDQQKFNLRYDYRGDVWRSATLLSGSNLNQETAGYVSGFEAYKDDSLKRDNPDPQAYRDSQSLRWHTRFERSTSNQGTFAVTPYARHAEMDFLMHFLPGNPIEENGQTSAGLQTTFRRAVTRDTVLTQGVDVEFTDAWLKQTQVEPVSFSSAFPLGKQYDYEVEAQLLAAFVTAETAWTESTRMTLGARLESLAYDYDNRMLDGNTDENGVPCGGAGCRYTRPADRDDDFENLSANADLIHSFSDALVASIRLSHGFRAPQATEMYRLQAGQTYANLDSEELNSVELGFRGTVGSLSYALTGFYMKKHNVIFQASDRSNIDNGETRHRGLEYRLFWQLGQYWDLSAAGTFARHEYTSDVTAPGSNTLISTDGNDVDTAPRHMGSVQLGWQPFTSTRVELEWIEMGKYYTDIENQHSYDGHNLLNLRLRQDLTDSLNLGLRVTNLTDEDYAERADYNSLSGGDRYFIGEPRSVYGDIQWRF